MREFRMPSLGADMEHGTLVEWNVKPGQKVKRGDVVAVVETQKGAVDVEIWDDGVVDQLVVETGTKVPVGDVLALLRGENEAPLAPYVAAPPPAAVPSAPVAVPAPVQAARREKVSPAARRRAAELGVDLDRIRAGGADGVVSIADVERAADTLRAAPADKSAAMRQAIGVAMAKSKREIPHYYLGTTIDVSIALDWLERSNRERPVQRRVLFAAVLLRAVALSLKDFQELNGFWSEGRFKPAAAVHLGVGIALRGGGLIAPAIHDAERKSLTETMEALADLIQRARSGALRSSELTDATVTVTNLGEQGVDTVYGVIYPPQVALAGFGKVGARPWVIDDRIEARRTLHATLSADHRASVGHRGAAFLAALARLLQEPETL
ncbi:MAG: dihydrolipoamide acetyltransferase family protein [Betaproteobacteria bacterium]